MWQKITAANRRSVRGNRRCWPPRSIVMNRERSKPIHVFREGSRGCVARPEGKLGGTTSPPGWERDGRSPATTGGETIFKPNAFARSECDHVNARSCRLFFLAEASSPLPIPLLTRVTIPTGVNREATAPQSPAARSARNSHSV